MSENNGATVLLGLLFTVTSNRRLEGRPTHEVVLIFDPGSSGQTLTYFLKLIFNVFSG